jgi:hypothetical protein
LVQNMGRQKLYNLILFYLLKIPSHAFGWINYIGWTCLTNFSMSPPNQANQICYFRTMKFLLNWSSLFKKVDWEHTQTFTALSWKICCREFNCIPLYCLKCNLSFHCMFPCVCSVYRGSAV